MCIVSMVHDHYRDRFPEPPPPSWPAVPQGAPWKWPAEERATPIDTAALDRLEKLIREFKEAVAAAEKLDTLMKKPDCVDPEKAKLQERVAELEKQLAAARSALGG